MAVKALQENSTDLPCGPPSHKLSFLLSANLRSVCLKKGWHLCQPVLASQARAKVNRSPGEDHFFTRAHGGFFQGNERLPLCRGEGKQNLPVSRLPILHDLIGVDFLAISSLRAIEEAGRSLANSATFTVERGRGGRQGADRCPHAR